MSTQSDMSVPDTTRPTFDPNLDIATEVFSHVQCVKTRVNLALVSKLWREASKPAAAYPLRFDFDMVPDVAYCMRRRGQNTDEYPDSFDFNDFPEMMIPRRIDLLDNDEALSLPYERVVGLLGEVWWDYRYDVGNYAAMRGSVRVLKWTRENNLPWDIQTCSTAAHNGHLPALKYLHENECPWDSEACLYAAQNGHLPALKYLHENGCPWDWDTCYWAAYEEHWDCLQYAVDNKCPGREEYAEEHAEHLR